MSKDSRNFQQRIGFSEYKVKSKKLSLCLIRHHAIKTYLLLNKAPRHVDVLG